MTTVKIDGKNYVPDNASIIRSLESQVHELKSRLRLVSTALVKGPKLKNEEWNNAWITARQWGAK